MSNYHRRKAWRDGFNACRDNLPRSTCTRQKGTIYFDDWHDGYSHVEGGRSA